MSLSKQILHSIERSSWIRQMFEEGNRLKQEFGTENVFDFSIGNPILEPPEKILQTLIELLQSNEKGKHRYMPNAGFPETRSYIAERQKKETDLAFELNDILLCAGAGGGLNVVLKTLCNPGDEIIVFSPYFVEYGAYAANHGAQIRPVRTTDQFQINPELLEEAITPNTKAILINSPNNPTGVIYPEDVLKKTVRVLERKSIEYGRPIYLVSDEPYKSVVYDQIQVPNLFHFYKNTIVVTSHSKDIAIPGERIGTIAISPQASERKVLQDGMTIAIRVLGFVNAPALMQRMIPEIGDTMIDLSTYKKNRDLLYHHLVELGFECVLPEGGFYLFPQCPIEDDVRFIKEAQKFKLLLTPGSGFGQPGYFRIAYCFETEMIERSLPVFSQLAKRYQMV